MKAKDLGELLATLRAAGVTRFKTAELELELGPLPLTAPAGEKVEPTRERVEPTVPPELKEIGVTVEDMRDLYAHVGVG